MRPKLPGRSPHGGWPGDVGPVDPGVSHVAGARPHGVVAAVVSWALRGITAGVH